MCSQASCKDGEETATAWMKSPPKQNRCCGHHHGVVIIGTVKAVIMLCHCLPVRHQLTYHACHRWQAEGQHKRTLFRGSFGTQRPGRLANVLDVIPKNVANTNVLLWGAKCWALFEAGQPYRLNPGTLQTLGLDWLDGKLRSGVPFSLGSVSLDKAAGGVHQTGHILCCRKRSCKGQTDLSNTAGLWWELGYPPCA